MTRRQALLYAAAAVVRPGIAAVPREPHFPAMRAVPLPEDQISFQRNEKEIALLFGPQLERPFVYPVIGPSGRTLTRMGHPGDPYTHHHHNSIWISFSKVNGISFWEDQGKDRGRIVQQQTVDLIDSDARAGIIANGEWVGEFRPAGPPGGARGLVLSGSLPASGCWLSTSCCSPAGSEAVTFDKRASGQSACV